VAIPAEHGGWALTAEPALLGLVVAPSLAVGALAVAAVFAFMTRTPLEIALVDRWRGRRLARTTVAERLAAVEIMALTALLVVASSTSTAAVFWIPLALALLLLAVELWFDMRSRGRRLAPELAGSLAPPPSQLRSSWPAVTGQIPVAGAAMSSGWRWDCGRSSLLEPSPRCRSSACSWPGPKPDPTGSRAAMPRR
jgi:hypothetical protein